jgi:16S rRNA C1402 N4-methylase RsmH
MTFGAGGHSTAILESNPRSSLICLDRDPTAIELGKQLANKYP